MPCQHLQVYIQGENIPFSYLFSPVMMMMGKKNSKPKTQRNNLAVKPIYISHNVSGCPITHQCVGVHQDPWLTHMSWVSTVVY